MQRIKSCHCDTKLYNVLIHKLGKFYIVVLMCLLAYIYIHL